MAQNSLTKLTVGQPTSVRHQHTLVLESFLGRRLLMSKLIADLVTPEPAPAALIQKHGPQFVQEPVTDGPGARS
jgi:hypothetical protein